MLAGLNRGQTKTTPAAKADVARKTTTTPDPNSVWQSLATNTTGLQAKLTVSQPGDPYEIEADRAADRIMRMETPSSHADRLSFSAFNGRAAQRKCDKCDEEEQQVQRKGDSNPVDVAAARVGDTLSSAGQPLDSSSRSFFEPRFARDLGDVRIHTGAKASESARALNAQAYTVGHHIVFGAGQYVPTSQSGRHLLAHELSHVSQQTNPRLTNTVQRQVGDPFTDPFGEGKKEEKKPALDPKTQSVYDDCPELCRKFPPVEIAPNVFVALCDDSVNIGNPDVRAPGCTPNRQGKLGFFSGAPGWQLPTSGAGNYQECMGHSFKAGSTKGLKIGYIQTVENCLSGGVYFKQDKSGHWVWAGNKWCCVKNARDGTKDSLAPWYGAEGSNVGPKLFDDTSGPTITDTPFTKLDARQGTRLIDRGVEGGGNPLRRMRIDGKFNLWLVAQRPNGSLVFIHYWRFESFIVAVLASDDADPCNITQWKKMGKNRLLESGPGQGPATPVLTGDVANKVAENCSSEFTTGDAKDKPKPKCNPEDVGEKDSKK